MTTLPIATIVFVQDNHNKYKTHCFRYQSGKLEYNQQIDGNYLYNWSTTTMYWDYIQGTKLEKAYNMTQASCQYSLSLGLKYVESYKSILNRCIFKAPKINWYNQKAICQLTIEERLGLSI